MRMWALDCKIGMEGRPNVAWMERSACKVVGRSSWKERSANAKNTTSLIIFWSGARNFVTDPGTCLASLNGTVGLECRQKVNMDVGSALEFAKMTAKAEMSARAGMEVIAIGCC